jgi:hypothetical protein
MTLSYLNLTDRIDRALLEFNSEVLKGLFLCNINLNNLFKLPSSSTSASSSSYDSEGSG